MVSFEIVPTGPFSWERATDFLATFPATSHHWQGEQTLRMAFPLDGTHAPAGVLLRWEDGVLHGRVSGVGDVEAVRRQVARVYATGA